MKDYCISGKFATACVTVNHLNIIIDTAPIFKAFEGQNLDSLLEWLKKKDGIYPVVTELSDD